MANVYIEPKPKARHEHEAIDHYTIRQHAKQERCTAAHIKLRKRRLMPQRVLDIIRWSLVYP